MKPLAILAGAALVSGAAWLYAGAQDRPVMRPDIPGAVLIDDLSKTCRRGYSASVRPPETISERYKLSLIEMLPATLSHSPRSWQLDDKVPICVGGKPGPDNWWLQPLDEAHAKDREEVSICREVCAGRVDIHDAQRYFLNWPDGTLQ